VACVCGVLPWHRWWTCPLAIPAVHSAPAVTGSSFTTFGAFNAGHFAAYVFDYHAASDSPLLTVELTLNGDVSGGNVALAAAAMR
jgi:hypothetical protein